MSRLKEPHFFVDNVRPPAVRVDDLAEYEALFSSDSKVRGEASPSYACYSQHSGAPERISMLLPDARFIYLVRDPIDRTVSHYLHRVAVENERRTFADALGDVDDPANPYTCPSRYATQLERYLEYFPPEQILVIDQVELLGERQQTLRSVFSFLGVDEGFVSPDFNEERGASASRRRYSTRYLRASERAAASPLRLLPRRTRRSLRGALERLTFRPLEKPSISPDLRQRLGRLYSPEVSRLRTLTGKPFSNWSL